VVTAGIDKEGPVLCCAYVPAAGLDVTAADLRADLSLLLPAYMLPTRWQALDQLPHDADGVVEREHIRNSFAEGRIQLG
jgi:non-ribosomal peptide synthetase component E (peptide arylation enzyme)